MSQLQPHSDQVVHGTSVRHVPVRIRPGNVMDVPWIIGESREFASSIGHGIEYLSPSNDFIRGLLLDGLSDPNGVILVAHKGEERVGMILGRVMSQPFNPAVSMLMEILWWVPVKYRRGRPGYMLLRDFLAIGERLADTTIITLQSRTDVSEKMLAKLGLKPCEFTFIKENTNRR